jgi:hypothetical protein
MANTSSDPHSAYMNFLRCVTAIATAGAGTTSLTINPFVSNGVIDSTRNCITSIDANLEAGGWTTSNSHFIPTGSPGGWDAAIITGSTLQGAYKADFYNSSGKGAYPYMKLTFHSAGGSSASTINALQYATPRAKVTNLTNVANTSFLQVMCTFGCSNTTDWTNVSYQPVGGNTAYNTGTQTTSFTFNEAVVSTASVPTVPAFVPHNPGVKYRMAVTSDYCILWEVPINNSYANNYSNVTGTSTLIPYARFDWSYGKLLYAGLRETQPWEDAKNNNPPWVTFLTNHRVANTNLQSATAPGMDNVVAAYMTTLNDSGVASANASVYFSNDINTKNFVTFDTSLTIVANTTVQTAGYPYQDYARAPNYIASTNLGLQVPLYYTRATGYGSGTASVPVTNQLYPPAYDPDTGSFVPPAVPIVIRRLASGTWNPGGAVRGIYKSLDMPIASMKNYFADNQTFTIGYDDYMPVVFNETMYLIRYA